MKKIINYFLSKIFPALVILIVTRELYINMEKSEFISYGLTFSSALLISNVLSLWISQATLRFFHNEFKSKIITLNLSYNLILLSLWILTLFLSVFNNNDTILVILLSISITIYTNVNSLYQAKFDSLKVLKQELFRSILLILLITLSIHINNNNVSNKYVIIAFSISYIIPVLFCTRDKILFSSSAFFSGIKFNDVMTFFKFGIPMGLWGGVAACYPVIERYFINANFNSTITADYYAVSELYYRGIGLLFVPVIMYLHPLLMKEYDVNKSKFNNLLLKGAGGQIISLMVVILLGFSITPIFLKYYLPSLNHDFYYNSYIFALVPFMWQIAYLSHKGLEVTNHTVLMLFTLLFSLAVDCLLMYFFIDKENIYSIVYIQVFSLFGYVLITSFLYFKGNKNESFKN
ncbi:hypothetical protein [Photobacterium leiognathi]|uniref:hypothetical protein n=1 Tax=Photobacterium leiognathi TaxID=553611 RepID=UPI0029816CE8|nr:hypothetical protein [Photobacterium leiognathi]